jgi:2-haloacid dehalogenase
VGLFSGKEKTRVMPLGAGVKALLFDTFGTTVDWLSSMTGHGQRLGAERGIEADWEGLMKEWRAHYKPAIKAVREGDRKWAGFDTLHREELDKIVGKFGLKKLNDADRDRLTLGWHELRAWPDVVSGLHRLKKHFIIGPLSNGTTRQLTDLAKFSGTPWDVVFGADMFRTYKPDKKLYLGATALLGLKPEEIMLVAAHIEDLQAAGKVGLKTCFVKRATEDAEVKGPFNVVVDDFEHLARVLDAA